MKNIQSYNGYLTKKIILDILYDSEYPKDFINYVSSHLKYDFSYSCVINKLGTECMYWTHNSQIYIILNGTQLNSLENFVKDAKIDLQTQLTPFEESKEIKVHCGWYSCLFKGNIIQKIQEFILNHPNHQINICGYSMGAALACIASGILAPNVNNRMMHVYMFGAPKPGNNDFKKYIKSLDNVKLFNIINHYDIAPTYPPIDDYERVSNKIYCIYNENICIKEDFNILNSYSIYDHFTKSFCTSLFNIYLIDNNTKN